MHKKAEELMFADLLQFGEDGKINLFNSSAFLFPTEYIQKIEERLKPDELYKLAKKIPLPIIKILADRKMQNLERLNFMLELAEVLGMGNIKVINFDQNKDSQEIIITNTNPNKVTCHHTRGYLASIFTDALKKDFECKETQCVSTGASECRFLVSLEK